MTEERQHPLKADILAIDDTPENLALLSQMLREKGYKVRSVTKGSTAIRGAKAGVRSKIVGNLKQAITLLICF